MKEQQEKIDVTTGIWYYDDLIDSSKLEELLKVLEKFGTNRDQAKSVILKGFIGTEEAINNLGCAVGSNGELKAFGPNSKLYIGDTYLGLGNMLHPTKSDISIKKNER